MCVCMCVCVCVRAFVRAFKVNHVWNIHTVTGGVTCCGLNAPTTGAGATPLRNICHNHHQDARVRSTVTVALNECIVLLNLPNKAHAHNNKKLIYNRSTARYWRPVLVTSPRNGGPEHQLLSEHQASPNTQKKHGERERDLCLHCARIQCYR